MLWRLSSLKLAISSMPRGPGAPIALVGHECQMAQAKQATEMRSAFLEGVEGAAPHRKKSCGIRRGSAGPHKACLRSSISNETVLNNPKEE